MLAEKPRNLGKEVNISRPTSKSGLFIITLSSHRWWVLCPLVAFYDPLNGLHRYHYTAPNRAGELCIWLLGVRIPSLVNFLKTCEWYGTWHVVFNFHGLLISENIQPFVASKFCIKKAQRSQCIECLVKAAISINFERKKLQRFEMQVISYQKQKDAPNQIPDSLLYFTEACRKFVGASPRHCAHRATQFLLKTFCNSCEPLAALCLIQARSQDISDWGGIN